MGWIESGKFYWQSIFFFGGVFFWFVKLCFDPILMKRVNSIMTTNNLTFVFAFCRNLKNNGENWPNGKKIEGKNKCKCQQPIGFGWKSERINRQSLLVTICFNVFSFVFMRYENRNMKKLKNLFTRKSSREYLRKDKECLSITVQT